MVFLKHGKYELPDRLLYDSAQYLFLDAAMKTVGIADVGYYFHGIPDRIEILQLKSLIMGQPFAILHSGNKKVPLTAPCSGNVVVINPEAMKFWEFDTYQRGYLVKLDHITETSPTLIGGREIDNWARMLERAIMPDRFTFKIVLVRDHESGKSMLRPIS